jgi:beta-galactosidase
MERPHHLKPLDPMLEVPVIGAEIFIEPGQTESEIDAWFRLLKECGMEVTRIRMFENYMVNADGHWDYTLFDMAFSAAEKYGIKIYANLFPATVMTDVGGFKFPKSEHHLAEIAVYIKNVVEHFRQFSSLYGWVTINEPGSGILPNDEFTRLKFVEWKKENHFNEYHDNGYVRFDLSEREFLVEYNIWFLKWLTDQIHGHHPKAIVHVNNHDIFKNAAEYDFNKWSEFLSSLGGSAHASWHFGYFTRSQYAVAMSANCEMLRSGAKGIPWLMTELQGGNNTYSGRVPLCPTKEEIAQWIWTTIGAGSKGAIFWCLNPRSSGYEAGEWAMIDFQDRPTDRLMMAAQVTKTISANENLFSSAKVVDCGIDVLYTRQSMWIESALKTEGVPFEGRDEGGVMKSALAYFEALSEMGVHAGFREISEYDFSKESYENTAIILAHQISIPRSYYAKLEDFVHRGGKLIIEGLTGFYDENAYFVWRKGFPLQKLYGARLKEFKAVVVDFSFSVNGTNLSGSFWKGYIDLQGADGVANIDGEVLASKNQFGAGEVFWLPAMAGLAARKIGDYAGLVKLLSSELKQSLSKIPITFDAYHKGMLMKILFTGTAYLAILINKSGTKQQVGLKGVALRHDPRLLFASCGSSLKGNQISIKAEETLVITWNTNEVHDSKN